MKTKANAIYAQSGGVTSVINASAYGVIKAAIEADFIENIYGGLNGITGILNEELVMLQEENNDIIEGIKNTPGAVLGSCRRKLKDFKKDKGVYQRLVSVFEAHNISYFFYNGGNDSMDTVHKLTQISQEMGYDLVCIGIPKTVDNDLLGTDNCPGYGSVAKYNAISIKEAAYDLASMYRDSSKVFVMETMGRHAGWITAATALARQNQEAPHLILLPEVPFIEEKFLGMVEETVAQKGYCVIAASEGIKDQNDNFIQAGNSKDMFGNTQLGGVGEHLKNMIKAKLNLPGHSALLDYCQRSARHICSAVDVEQAIACGRKAVEIAREKTDRMVTIERLNDSPYEWGMGDVDIALIGGKEKILPAKFYDPDNYDITEEFIKYAKPLINGENYPPFSQGLPNYIRLNKKMLPKKLPNCPEELLKK